MARRLSRPWLLALAACLWWLAVIVCDFLRFTPNPSIGSAWIDWRQMDIVFRIAPWMMFPFVMLAAWGLALRVRAGRVPPSWMIWSCGMAALAWTGFVFWRAHDQAFNCALWAPREELFGGTQCWLPHILASSLPWLMIPLAAWLVLAALRLPLHTSPEALEPACPLPSSSDRC